MHEIIRIENLYKSYDSQKDVLKNLSINIFPGKIYLLAGANGAGKTTLFNLMTGQLKPDCGDIKYNKNYLERGYKSIAYCTQLLSIDWYLNVFDNVMLGAYLNYDEKQIAAQEAHKALSLLKLSEYEQNSVEQLSGGQQQRVQIARALASNPKIMLLDEPIVGLDIESCIQVMCRLREMVDKYNLTIIVSSHQLSFIENYCDEIVLLDSGEFVANKSIKEFKKEYSDMFKIVIETSDDISLEDIKSISNHIILCKDGNLIEIIYKIDDIPSILYKKYGEKITQIRKESLSLDDIFLIRKEVSL